VILSGPIGAGKTTVAKELVKITPDPVAYIEGDTFWSYLPHAKGKDIERNAPIVMRAMTAASVPFAVTGHEVILDFTFGPWFLETVQRIVRDRAPIDYVILSPSLEVCAERAANRPEGKITDYGIYKPLYDSFEGANKHLISEDSMSAKDVAAMIRKGLDLGEFRLAPDRKLH